MTVSGINIRNTGFSLYKLGFNPSSVLWKDRIIPSPCEKKKKRSIFKDCTAVQAVILSSDFPNATHPLPIIFNLPDSFD